MRPALVAGVASWDATSPGRPARPRSSRSQGRQAARGSERDLRDHGWFVFFAPRDNPELAGVIFGEHNEHGYLGAPIAKHVVETYFAKKEGQPLPVLQQKTAPVQPAKPPAAPVVADAGPAPAPAAQQ